MHITIDCRMWGEKYGGIGRYTTKIVLYLLKYQSWDFTLLYTSGEYDNLKEYEQENIHLIPCNAKMFSIKEQWEIWRKVPYCDVFWCPYMNIPFLKTKARKTAVTLHDVFHIANPQYYSKLKRLAIAPYYFFSTRNSDTIFTVSQFSKSEIEKYFGERIAKKVKMIYNGCEINDKGITAPNVGYEYFLFVGSIKPHKNLRNALLAFMGIENLNYKFVIVGKKEGFITGDKYVFDLVNQMNTTAERVIFTGNVSDKELYSWYKGAKTLVMPSFYEGFGLPLVEAMHFNIPIICSDIPVFHEICGKLVQYFNPYDYMDIRNKMEIAARNCNNVTFPQWRNWAQTSQEIKTMLESLIQSR